MQATDALRRRHDFSTGHLRTAIETKPGNDATPATSVAGVAITSETFEMRHINRKTTPKVVGGKPLRKNRWTKTPNYYNTAQDIPAIDRRRPGPGYRHALKKRDVERFIRLLPDWEELSRGLNAILMAPGRLRLDGWYRRGIVAVCAWEIDREIEISGWYYHEHRKVFRQIGIPCEEIDDDNYLCKFTERTVRAYQLLHILLHELGHHHDLMTTKSKKSCSRGETFAERYALSYADRIWESYINEFGLP